MSVSRAVACLLGIVLLAIPAGAQPQGAVSDTDLAWVGTLPGFTLKDKAGSETSYLVSGDAKEGFVSLTKALTERGWRIEPGKSNTVSALSAQRMTATKGNVEAFFHMKQAAILTKLIVTTRTLEAAPAAASAPAVKAGPAVPLRRCRPPPERPSSSTTTPSTATIAAKAAA